MARPSTVSVRFALVGIFAALALAFAASDGGAQPAIPGFPPRPVMPPRPEFPARPEIPRPGAMPGFGGLPTYKWSCGKCNASLGETNSPTNPHARCPVCGVVFTGTKIDNGPPGAVPGRLGGNFGGPPTAPATPSAEPALPTNPALTNPGPASAPPTEPSGPPAATSGTSPAPDLTLPPPGRAATGGDASPAPEAASSGKSKLKLIGIAVGVILFLGALAALGVAVSNASGGKPVKRKKKPRFDDDD